LNGAKVSRSKNQKHGFLSKERNGKKYLEAAILDLRLWVRQISKDIAGFSL